MTFRAPLISRPSQVRKPDSMMARTFVSAGLALLVGASARSTRCPRCWPVAPRTNAFRPQTITTNLVPLNSIAVVALPTGKAADRGSEAESAIAYINLSWIETNDLCRQLAVTLPKQITDWPLASRLKVINRDGQLQNVAALNTVAVSTQPFSLLDWQLPKKWKTDPPDVTYSESLALTVVVVTKPFLQLGWDLPGRKDSPLARERQRVNDLSRQLAVTLPARPYDWPIPKPKRAARIPDTLYGTSPPFKVVASPSLSIWRRPRRRTRQASISATGSPRRRPPDTWTPVPVNPDMWTAVNVNPDIWTKKNG